MFKSTDYRDQKTYMRRYMVKPRSLSIRPYVARVRELNAYLEHFPTGNVNVEATSLGEDEIKDILFHSIPKSWQQHMVKQGYSYQEESVTDFISFCERLEAIETPIPKKKSAGTKSTHKSSRKKGKRSVLNLTIAMRTTTIQMVLSIVNCTVNAAILRTSESRKRATQEKQVQTR